MSIFFLIFAVNMFETDKYNDLKGNAISILEYIKECCGKWIYTPENFEKADNQTIMFMLDNVCRIVNELGEENDKKRKKQLTEIDNMRKRLRPIYREGYIDSLTDKDIIEIYKLTKI